MSALQRRWCCGMGGAPADRPNSLESLRGATEQQLRLSILADVWQLGASEAVSMSARGVCVCVCMEQAAAEPQRGPQGSYIAPSDSRA